MNKYSEKIWVLITRELSGEASPAEKKELRKWLEEDYSHREFYSRITSCWEQEPGESINALFFNFESGLNKLRSKLGNERSAALNTNRLARKRPARMYTRTLAAAVVLIVISLSVFLTLHIWEAPESATIYATSSLEQRIITLSDGSVVRLNQNSKLQVQENRDEGLRQVRLEGEAFFDVTRNPERSFVIHAGDAVVEVLGTSFNVKEGNEVLVAVQEGLVSFRHQNHEDRSAARLAAGQLGLLSEGSNDVKIEETDVENYMSWKNGYLNFRNMPFDQVLRQLERIYGIKHQVQDSSVSSNRLTAYTEKVQLEEVIETIALALELEYDKQEDAIIWTQRRQ
jgi:transmembrane sensor